MKFRTVLIVTLVLTAALAVGWGVSAEEPERGGTLVIGRTSDSEILDMQRTTAGSSLEVCALIQDYLWFLDENMEFIPGLAESWEWSEDGLVLTIHLRRGVRFHCGHPFNAEVVKFTIERWRDPAIASPTATDIEFIDYVEVIDEYTVRIVHWAENRYVMDVFATAYGAPMCPCCIEKWGEDYGIKHVCGTGPFKFYEWIADDRIVLVRNEEYTWGPALTDNRGPAYLEKIVWRVIPEALTRVMELEVGGIDLLQAIPPDEVPVLEADPEITVLRQPAFGVRYIGFNVQSGFETDDPLVRRAIAHAINREEIVNYVFGGFGRPLYGPMPSIMWGYCEGVREIAPEFDPELGRKLLAEAGFPEGLTVTLWCVAVPEMVRWAEVVKAQLAEIGVEVIIESYEWVTLLDLFRIGEPQMWLLGYGWFNADIIYWFFHTDNKPSPNRMLWGDQKTDALLARIRAVDDEVALEALRTIEYKIITEDVVWIPIMETETQFALRPEVRGIEALHPLMGWRWKILDMYIEGNK